MDAGNIKFISCVEQNILHVCFAHSWDILVNTQNNLIFPPINVLFSIYDVCNSVILNYGVYNNNNNSGGNNNSKSNNNNSNNNCLGETSFKPKTNLYVFNRDVETISFERHVGYSWPRKP